MFENSLFITLLAFTLLIGQTLWWYFLMRKPKTKDTPNNSKWVIYATQTGSAQQLAQQTADQLNTGKESWSVISMEDWLTQHTLSELNHTTTLFVASTQGDGDPPDNGMTFFQSLRNSPEHFEHFTFAILGLGDELYDEFCGFANNLHTELTRLSATPIFDMIKVDDLDADAITQWFEKVSEHFSLNAEQTAIDTPLEKAKLIEATLTHRLQENSGSPTPPLYTLNFSLSEAIEWQAGDIADVLIPATSEPDSQMIKRVYTLANIPNTENGLTLLVRQLQKDNGELGVGSGYLTQTLQQGQSLSLSVKNNPCFHLPDKPTPLILIATGSGLAGMLSLLQHIDNYWNVDITHHLIFGERFPAFDTPCREQLERYTAKGILHTDYCFSQGESDYSYVQDALRGQSDAIKDAINNGAMVYVCGSKTALGESIPQTLHKCLGDKAYETFMARDGLKMDVY